MPPGFVKRAIATVRLAARIALRQILALYASVPPERLTFAAGARGKPAIAGGSPLRFSLSRAAGRAVLAVTWQREVGVDLEPRDPDLLRRQEWDTLLTAACSAAEARRLRNLPRQIDRLDAFLRLWTLKEAYLKGIGLGLYSEPRDLEIAIDEDGRARVRHEAPLSEYEDSTDPARWALRLLDAGDGWIAALAVAGAKAEIVEHTWPARPFPGG